MRLLILIASVWAIAHAKPEMYRESEDFQYSRSSSDEGSKSGFYGAQRGNMGGNYERAHNMDGLAQHQMSTAVRQVEGELGDGAKERSGSVYTAANSRGVFGSGHYDLSNLKGRNFGESSGSDALSHSSLISQNAGYRGLAHNSGYNSGYTKSSRHTGYAAADYSEDHSTDFTQSKAVDNAQQAINQHSYSNQAALGSDYKYYSHGANRAESQVIGANRDQSQVIGTNLHSAYDAYGIPITDRPIRVVMRPGTIVTVPVSAQTYDASSSSIRGASYGQNLLNTEAEELSNSDSSVHVKPNTVYYTKPKHYESSYSYRKQWEKHNAQPVASIPTENPFAKNSDLYDDSLLLQNAKGQFNAIDSSSAHVGSDAIRSSSANIAHMKSVNAAQQSNRYNTKSSSGHQYNFETAQSQNAAASAHSNAYTLGSHNIGAAVDANDLVENIDTKPKSYHSSYSYHKAWERRGDPYVIKPIGGDNSAQISQRLVSGSANQDAYSSHQYGSLYNQAHQSLTKSGVDCDENGHIRVARSPYGHHYQQQEQQFEELGQRTQNQWDRLEDLGQQTQNQWDRLEDLGQQTQSKWDNNQGLGQQSQNLEDFGQQSQNLEDFGQQSQHLEDFGQQSQNLEDFGQQSQNLEDFGQQSQNLEDLGQHTENLDQQTQNQWDKYEKHNEQPPSNIHQDTQEIESFQESKLNNQNMGPLNIFNQYPESEQKLNSFWHQDQNFEGQEVSQSTDQIGDFTNENIYNGEEFKNQLEIQNKLIGRMYDILSKPKKNEPGVDPYQSSNTYNKPIQHQHSVNYKYDDSPYHTGFSHYSHQSSNNGISTSWQRNYQVQGNDQPTSLLQNFWSKLDNLDAQGSLSTNEKAHDENSYAQMSGDIDWDNLGQFNTQHNNQMFEGFSSQSEDKFLATPQILKKATTVHSILFSTENAPTTVKPKYHPSSNIPVQPMDVGRGDIGADETTEPANENEQTNVYIDKSPQRHYKTMDEIESLSLTKENNTNSKMTTANSQPTTEDKFNNHDVIGHIVDDVSLNNPKQTFTTTKTIEYKPKYSNIYTDKYTTPRLRTVNKQKETLSDDIQKVQASADIEPLDKTGQKYTDQQDFLSSYDFGQHFQEPWQMSEIQQNTDQQFEDLGQELQGSYDIGQQSKPFWVPSNSGEQSEVQTLEHFTLQNKDNQQYEPLERSNDKLQSQSFLKFEQNSMEPIAQNKIYNQQQSPMPSNIEKEIEQLSPSMESAHISPEEITTEKPGFWKSVGSKLTNAKDRVVSWFKTS